MNKSRINAFLFAVAVAAIVTGGFSAIAATTAGQASYATFASGKMDVGSDSDDEKDSPQARADEREEDLYDQGTDYIDDHEWRKAADVFTRVGALKRSHADAALYWKAYSLYKLGQRSDALDTLVEFQKSYPRSRWGSDARQLEAEIRQSAGQKIEPENVDNDDLKLMAINSLMGTDPERAIPLLEKVLNSGAGEKVKDRALFVLSQSNSPRAQQIIGDVARGRTNRDLQERAIRYLGISGGEESRKQLADIYSSTADADVKRSVLRSFMISGDKARVLNLARTESDPELRGEAARQLGIMGGRVELDQLYNSEPSVEVKEQIIKAMFLGGNAEKLADIARSEKVVELRETAVKNLSLLGSPKTGPLLVQIYNTDKNTDIREAVIRGLFIQGNAQALIELARKETDRDLKHEIIKKLSIMHSKEAVDYMMEFLKE